MTPGHGGERGLRAWNVAVGSAHLVQGLLVLALGNDFTIDVVVPVQEGPPGTPLSDPVTLFGVRYSYAIAAFLFLAAADHLAMAAPRVVRWYERNLRRGNNPARWAEYSVSASLMIVLIAMLTGITNGYALLALFGVNAAMILFGALMERVNPDRARVDWWPFAFGCIAGVVPWIAIALALAVAEREGPGAPGFVYGIFVSLFVFYNSFALNQWLQYRGRGRFADYLFGERVYLILSLGAKSALAWQVFAGALAD
jgi:hypothetical protein